MNGWDDVLKARARREDCPLPQGFEEQIQKELDWLPVQARQQKGPFAGRCGWRPAWRRGCA